MLSMPKYTHIVIHHSWSKDHDTLDWSGIRAYHMSYRIDDVAVSKEEYIQRQAAGQGTNFTPPWSDIGYHYGIESVAGYYEALIGRPLYRPGAHCREYGMNTRSVGVCIIGNYDSIAPDEKALDICARCIIAPLMIQFAAITLDNIKPHHEYATYKLCPGKLFDMTHLREIVRYYTGQ